MELGATVCTPRAPCCGGCPVARWCRAFALGRVAAFPPVPARRTVEKVRQAVVLIERRGRMLVVRREGPLLAGLWEPPGVDLAPRRAARAALDALLSGLGLRARLVPAGKRIRYAITHRDITAEVWHGELMVPLPRVARLRWVDPRDPGVALTALARKLAARRRVRQSARRCAPGAG